MTKPYIVCHMMASIDGRIDCKMTAKIQGVEQYYETLEALNTPTTVSGRVTALLELAQDGQFQTSDSKVLGREAFSKKTDADGYCVVVDTKGTQVRMFIRIILSTWILKIFLGLQQGRTILIWLRLAKFWLLNLMSSAWQLSEADILMPDSLPQDCLMK